jgi:hypothetical protein
MQVQTPVKAIPQSPISPVAQAREKERMTTLLEINTLLIKEVVELQGQGKAGVVTQPNEGGDKPQPSKEYVEYGHLTAPFILLTNARIAACAGSSQTSPFSHRTLRRTTSQTSQYIPVQPLWLCPLARMIS